MYRSQEKRILIKFDVDNYDNIIINSKRSSTMIISKEIRINVGQNLQKKEVV